MKTFVYTVLFVISTASLGAAVSKPSTRDEVLENTQEVVNNSSEMESPNLGERYPFDYKREEVVAVVEEEEEEVKNEPLPPEVIIPLFVQRAQVRGTAELGGEWFLLTPRFRIPEGSTIDFAHNGLNYRISIADAGVGFYDVELNGFTQRINLDATRGSVSRDNP